jgi:uncharacterized tellurite resistance protein B-like protein
MAGIASRISMWFLDESFGRAKSLLAMVKVFLKRANHSTLGVIPKSPRGRWPSPMSTIQTIVAVFLLASATALAVAYWRYTRTPASRWKYRVFALIRDLQTRREPLRIATDVVEAVYTRLATEAFTMHLQTIPVERLAAFSGIGPVTITRLQEAGFRTLADVAATRFDDLPDIGAARAKALRAAVDSLLRDARSRFDAGACPEAQVYRHTVDALRASEEDGGPKRERELAAVEAALHEAYELFPFAREVTFFKFLRRIDMSLLLVALISQPLPQPREIPPDTAPAPAPAKPATPAPPAVPLPSVGVAAKPTPGPFTLSPPAPAVPQAASRQSAPPTDLFRAALDAQAVPSRGTPAEHPDLARMRAVIGLGFVVAKVDGRVAQAERKAIRAFLETTFGHDAALRRNIDPLMEQIGKATPTEAAALAAVTATVPIEERPAVYRWVEQIADAAGERNQKERDALARIATGLGLVESSRPAAQAPSSGLEDPTRPTNESPQGKPTGGPSPPPDHRAVLEIAGDVPLDPELIRRRFQLLTDKLDPTKAAAFGPEFARMAEEKRARVRVAAEALMAPFGEPLEKSAPPAPTDLRHNPDLDDVFGA